MFNLTPIVLYAITGVAVATLLGIAFGYYIGLVRGRTARRWNTLPIGVCYEVLAVVEESPNDRYALVVRCRGRDDPLLINRSYHQLTVGEVVHVQRYTGSSELILVYSHTGVRVQLVK